MSIPGKRRSGVSSLPKGLTIVWGSTLSATSRVAKMTGQKVSLHGEVDLDRKQLPEENKGLGLAGVRRWVWLWLHAGVGICIFWQTPYKQKGPDEAG